MGLSSKERVALWRQRQRENPNLHEQYKAKERERNKKRRELGARGRQSITNVSEREKRIIRKGWRTAQRNKRHRDKDLLNSLQDTPPNSPPLEDIHGRQPINLDRPESVRRRGRKKVKRDRAKAYRTIGKLQVALFRQKQLVQKWRKRCYRLNVQGRPEIETKVNKVLQGGDTHRALLLSQFITDRIKQRYLTSKSWKEKRYISSLVCAFKTIRRYRLGLYAKQCLGIRVRQDTGSTRTARHITPKSKSLVSEFLNRDDNSRIKAGKKSTITRKGEKRQISLMNFDLKTLHNKFLAEKLSTVSYSLFCKFKPFNILKPSSRDRETCLCRICENILFKLERCYFEKAFPSRDIDKALQTITCDTNSKECMYRECLLCKTRQVAFNDDVDVGKQVSWFTWKTKRVQKQKKTNGDTIITSINVTAKDEDSGSLHVLMEEVNKDLLRVAKHTFNIRHQYQSIRHLKDNLTPEDVIIHIDFSENYNCKYAKEVQSMHFGSSQKQISLHTGVAYTKDSTLSFCTVSDSLKHSPASIWAHLHPILEQLRRETNATTVHFVSDGPTTQYRNKQNFYLLSSRVFEYGFQSATWNFLEAGHGKGAADGIGAVVKRTGDAFVNTGGDIIGADDLVNAVKKTGTKVQLMQISTESIDEIEEAVPLSLKPLPKTMQIHQVMVTGPGQLRHRTLSSFCSKPMFCDCFGAESTFFSVQSDPHIEDDDPIPSTSSADSSGNLRPKAGPCLQPVTEVHQGLVSQYCVIKYDGRAFPGLILTVDEEDELEVMAMHRVGRNRFFWPMFDDVIWYAKDSVLTLLESPPSQVTKRHLQVDPEIWSLVEAKEDV